MTETVTTAGPGEGAVVMVHRDGDASIDVPGVAGARSITLEQGARGSTPVRGRRTWIGTATGSTDATGKQVFSAALRVRSAAVGQVDRLTGRFRQ